MKNTKKVLFAIVAMLLIAGVAIATRARDKKTNLFTENLELLARGENDGALYMNEQYSLYCCGPGNVRDCEGYALCNFGS